ncbi:MAG: hypothetical protein JW870_16790 [Candidatus Delongbacteria bacterium]|nr:hypothetical protein [Candidatus Delongbacteria bacterium]
MGLLKGPQEPTPQIGDMKVEFRDAIPEGCFISLCEWLDIGHPHGKCWVVRVNVSVNDYPTEEERQTLTDELPTVFRELDNNDILKDIALPTYFVEDAILLAFMGIEPRPEPAMGSGRGFLEKNEFTSYLEKVQEIATRLRPRI